MATVNEKYTARTDASEGQLFYDNKLNHPQFEKKYFPQTKGETNTAYTQRPKIAVPISSSIVDRIINILNFNTIFSTENKEHQTIIDDLSAELNMSEVLRDIMVKTLVTGNNVTVITDGMEYPNIKHWDGQYAEIVDNKLFGYQYVVKDDIIFPVLTEPSEKEKENITTVLIDDKVFGDTQHILGFSPAVLFRNIDKYESGKYGKSYIERFNNLIVEYNQVISQASKSIKILQNVWKTNRSIDNPEKPIRINPDTINFLGADGTLEQVIRELDLSEEWTYLDRLEHQISRASQVPAELSGLKDVGKLPSGIALQLLLQPLTELTMRLRNSFQPKFIELMEKLVSMQYIIDGKTPPADLAITIQMNENVLPEDRTAKINEIITLKREGLISEEQSKLLIAPLLNIEGNV